jgi:hypothetical protein
VEGKPHVVEHYLTAGGRDPFQDWLKGLRELEGALESTSGSIESKRRVSSAKPGMSAREYTN